MSNRMTQPGARALTPLTYLSHAATVAGSNTAAVDGERRIDYRTLHRRALRLAGALRSLGVRPGDRVALLSPNRTAVLEAHFGVPAAGAALVALNVRLSRAELRYILDDCAPRVTIVDAELAELLPAGSHTITVSDDTNCEYEAELARATPLADLTTYLSNESQPISINYTSGTTGRPKGAVYTHRGAFLQARNAADAIGLTNGSVLLWTLPMFHCNGWCYPWAGTAARARHVVLRRIDPELIWKLLDAEGVTHYCCAPTVQTSIVHAEGAHTLERPVTVAMGGAPPSPALIAEMQRQGFEALHLYGLTETYGPKTAMTATEALLGELDPDEHARVLARQGHPISPLDEVSVMDSDLRPVDRDGATLGEVAIRGATVTAGYLGQPEATHEAFRDGWLMTGDLAVWHPDGAIELRDRAKDVIVSGGENISSIEVEQVLCEHPAVLEAAVVAVPDSHWGERPKAFVTLRPAAEADADTLIGHCRERLAGFKCPVAIEVAELPRTATGKVRKAELREREWAGMDRRIN